MITLILSFLSFLLFYFLLKSFYPAWDRRQLPQWSRVVTGLLAWATVISFGGMLVGAADPVVELFSAPNFGTAFKLIIIALSVQAVLRYSSANPEFFDFSRMKFFITRALQFESPLMKKENIFEELDKHEIKRVYRETTGKELKAEVSKREEKNKTVRTNEEAVKKMSAQPPQSPHLKVELQQLTQGTVVDITDSWKINSLRKAPHAFYAAVTEATIDPTEKRLTIAMVTDKITQKHLQPHPALLHVKQELYDFFQLLHQQDWMQPYLKFVKKIECTCSELMDDPFAGPQLTPLLQAEITTDELLQYRNRFFHAGELRMTLLTSLQ
jgi:hypothetical protein